MTDNELPTNPERPNGSEGEAEVVEIVEVVEVVEIIEEPLADTAAVDAAIARSAAPVDAAPASTPAPAAERTGPLSLEDVFGATAPVAAAAAVTESSAPSWGPETVAPAPGFAPEAAAATIVTAPVPPKRKSNRGFATLVALIGTAAFTALYAGVVYLLYSISGAARVYTGFLESPIFWGASIVFFVVYALLGILINRGPYWVHVAFSLAVAVLTYLGVIGLTLVGVRAWTLSYAEAAEVLRQAWLSPFAITAAIIAHEVPIWFGGWIARNGRKVTERNQAAMDAYEQEIADGSLFS